MQDFRTLDQVAQEARRRARGRNISWLLLLVVVLAISIDYAFFWPRASTLQREIERTINAYPLPQDSTQFDFASGHQSHLGWATRAVLSGQTPQTVCEFYLAILTADGWQVESQDCIPSSTEAMGWRDVEKGHYLLSVRRQGDMLRLRYFGKQGTRHVYRLTLSWRA